MDMTKYNYHPDLQKYQNFSTVIVPVVMPFLQKLMRVLYRMEKEDADVQVKTLQVPSFDGEKIRVLEYSPKDKESEAAIVVYHGGGFTFQGAPHHFSLARNLCKQVHCKVYFVDYRLAPTYKFPYAVEDGYAVYQWIVEHAEEVKIDKAKIAVCGDSAGGNLATVVCLMAKDRKIQMPCVQMLLYPVTDYRRETESMKRYVDTPMCNQVDVNKYYQMYVDSYTNENYKYLSPMEAKLDGMPTTYVEVAQYDCLHDEGVNYAKALADVQVSVELHEMKDAMHGYDIAEDTEFMNEIMKKRITFLCKNLSK